MVSTRSQSRLTQQEDIGEEVTSTIARSSARAKKSAPKTSPALPAIIEEPSKTLRGKKKSGNDDKNKAPNSIQIDENLMDKLADDIFAALEQGFNGNNKEADSDEEEPSTSSSDEDNVDVNEYGLRWRPSIRLPGINPNNKDKSTTLEYDEDDLLVDKHGSLNKQLHVPSADARQRARAARKEAPDTAGAAWFNLPATAITDEVKNDLRLLRLRSAFDPKKFYKKFDDTKFPKYFQFGTVVEGASEFYSSRMTKKERMRTFTEEVMANSHLSHVRKKRYNKMQEESNKWSNKPSKKTENSRFKKKPARPKH